MSSSKPKFSVLKKTLTMTVRRTELLMSSLQSVFSLTQSHDSRVTGNRRRVRGYMASRHFLCVHEGGSVKSLLDFNHEVVSAGSVCYNAAETNEYGVKEDVKEEIHVVLWLLTVKLKKGHVDIFFVQGSHATEDFCFDVSWFV